MEGEKQNASPLPDVFCFLDADLAADLRHLPEFVAAIRAGADLAVGTRYARGAHAERSVLRHVISRLNRLVLRVVFGLTLSDPPCGMKAVSLRVVRDIVPQVRDTQWFADTELCIRAARAGLRIVEIPVTWCEPRPGSALGKVFRITRANLRAMRVLAREIDRTSPP